MDARIDFMNSETVSHIFVSNIIKFKILFTHVDNNQHICIMFKDIGSNEFDVLSDSSGH